MSHREQPGFNKLVGFYRGKVLKHLSRGFCKIWIPGVYSDEWNSYEQADLIPSAEQAAPLSFGTNTGNGVFSYPNIGSTVWCFFANGDQNYPVYFASTLGGPEANANWDNARAMPGSHPEDAYVHKVHIKNSDIEVYETGRIKLHTENGENHCDILMDADGNITIDSTTQISLHSKNIILNADTQLNVVTPSLKVDATTQCDITSPEIKTTSSTQFKVESPAINLDSKAGGTMIISSTSTTTF